MIGKVCDGGRLLLSIGGNVGAFTAVFRSNDWLVLDVEFVGRTGGNIFCRPRRTDGLDGKAPLVFDRNKSERTRFGLFCT